jgi:hypothetical protein
MDDVWIPAERVRLLGTTQKENTTMRSILSGPGRLISALLFAALATFGLAACGDDSGKGMNDLGLQDTQGPNDTVQTPTQEPTEKTDSAPDYEGPYDAKFRAWVNDNDDSTVAVTGNVEQVISENAFTLAGEGDSEDLLVVGADKVSGLQAGSAVTVTGTVHKAFNLPGVEDDIHVDFEDDNVLQGFDRDPYVEATQVDTSAPAATP